MAELTDNEVRERLKDVDEDGDISVTSWEASFIEDIVYKTAGDLSDKEREKALEIIDKYHGSGGKGSF